MLELDETAKCATCGYVYKQNPWDAVAVDIKQLLVDYDTHKRKLEAAKTGVTICETNEVQIVQSVEYYRNCTNEIVDGVSATLKNYNKIGHKQLATFVEAAKWTVQEPFPENDVHAQKRLRMILDDDLKLPCPIIRPVTQFAGIPTIKGVGVIVTGRNPFVMISDPMMSPILRANAISTRHLWFADETTGNIYRFDSTVPTCSPPQLMTGDSLDKKCLWFSAGDVLYCTTKHGSSRRVAYTYCDVLEFTVLFVTPNDVVWERDDVNTTVAMIQRLKSRVALMTLYWFVDLKGKIYCQSSSTAAKGQTPLDVRQCVFVTSDVWMTGAIVFVSTATSSSLMTIHRN
jgi:hypothetical protein